MLQPQFLLNRKHLSRSNALVTLDNPQSWLNSTGRDYVFSRKRLKTLNENGGALCATGIEFLTSFPMLWAPYRILASIQWCVHVVPTHSDVKLGEWLTWARQCSIWSNYHQIAIYPNSCRPLRGGLEDSKGTAPASHHTNVHQIKAANSHPTLLCCWHTLLVVDHSQSSVWKLHLRGRRVICYLRSPFLHKHILLYQRHRENWLELSLQCSSIQLIILKMWLQR